MLDPTKAVLLQAAAQLLLPNPASTPSLATGTAHPCREGQQKETLLITRGEQNKDIHPEPCDVREHGLAFRHRIFYLLLQHALLLPLWKAMESLCCP